MKQIIRSLLRQFIFWILFFDVSRIVFLIYYSGQLSTQKIRFFEILGTFYYSFPLDMAVACYFLIIPFFILALQLFFNVKWLNVVNKIYTSVMVFMYSLSVAGELGIYEEWQSKLSVKAVKYLEHPAEVYNSAQTGSFFLLIAILILLTAAGIVCYVKWFHRDVAVTKRNPWYTGVFLLLTPGLLALGSRGGVQEIPINQSESYFSHQGILNDVSVNNAFNFFVSFIENYRVIDKNPYHFMDSGKARDIVKGIYRTEKDTTLCVLNNPQPNIVLIILESFSADLIESLGAKPGITPEFKKLEKEGLSFTRLYSSGMRSEQGMASIFGGFPSHPISCSVVQPEKYPALPKLPELIKEKGYFTSFYFGGQLIYGNIKGYIYSNGFDRIVEGTDFPRDFPRGKLGIPDGYVLDYLAKELGKNQQPFFSAVFTISSHSPYDQPYEKPLKWGGSENDFINSAYYTDHCLGEFFKTVRNTAWYKNTLFVLLADHSHSSYYNWYPGQKQYRRIPMLLLGGALKEEYQGTVCNKLGNNYDFPATLLTQLGISDTAFHWSKNLLNPYSPEFAYFSNENGYGWIRPGMQYSLDIGKEWIYADEVPAGKKELMKTEGEAYLQCVFEDYLAQ